MKWNFKHIIAITWILFLSSFAVLVLKDTRWRGRLMGDINYQDQLPTWQKENWLYGTFQDSLQDYLESNYGFRNYFIRSRNQIYYSFFNEPKSQGVIVGKNGVLYEKNYLDEYVGINFAGDTYFQDHAFKLKSVQDTLKKLGKDLVIVIAPGKASMYPNDFPEPWSTTKSSVRDYSSFVSACNKNQVQFFDASSWFHSLKKSAEYPLYSKTGIHWTVYGGYLFMDSLIRQLNGLGHNLSLFTLDSLSISNAKYPDNDIEAGMNLLSELEHEKFAYPSYHVKQKSESSIVLVGDSYLGVLYDRFYFHNLFKNHYYYFYNHDCMTNVEGTDRVLGYRDRIEQLAKVDVILLLETECHAERAYFGYVDYLYNYYFERNEWDKQWKELEDKMNMIKGIPEWNNQIIEKSKSSDLSYEKLLELDALYMIESNKKK